jgi:hypothetical protein
VRFDNRPANGGQRNNRDTLSCQVLLKWH